MPEQRGRLIWVHGLRLYGHRVEWHGERVPMSLARCNVVHLLAGAPGKPHSIIDIYALYRNLPGGHRRTEADISVDVCVRGLMRKIRGEFRAIDPEFDEIISLPPRAYAWRNRAVDQTEKEEAA